MRISLIIYAVVLLYSVFTIAMQQPAERWKGRAVPLAYFDNKWHVLFGHNAQQNNWSDFAEESKPRERGNAVAERALAAQTNNVLAISVRGAPYVRLANGDVVHFVPVQHISGKELYNRARNTIKDDFVWISIDDFLAGRGLERVRNPQRQKHPFAPIANVLRQELPKIIAQLPVPGQVPAAQPTSTSIPINVEDWRRIPGIILFYNKSDPYYEFTNFLEGYPVFLKNKWWPTTEHYYQAQKFTGHSALQEKIRNLRTPREALSEARANRNKIRADWQSVNLDIMIEAVLDKFSRYPALKSLLLNTGDRVLAEDSPMDDFFGVGKDGTGKNHLGQILMYVRDILREVPVKQYEWHSASYYLARTSTVAPVTIVSTTEGILEGHLAQLNANLIGLKRLL